MLPFLDLVCVSVAPKDSTCLVVVNANPKLATNVLQKLFSRSGPHVIRFPEGLR